MRLGIISLSGKGGKWHGNGKSENEGKVKWENKGKDKSNDKGEVNLRDDEYRFSRVILLEMGVVYTEDSVRNLQLHLGSSLTIFTLFHSWPVVPHDVL